MMMKEQEEDIDLSLSTNFYTSQLDKEILKKNESVDINISDGEVVTIDLNEELPEASELSTLLTNEYCDLTTWCIIAKRYAIQDRYEEALELINEAFKATNIMELSNQDKLSLNNLTTWIQILTKNLPKAFEESNIVQQINQLDFVNLITNGWINFLQGNVDYSYEVFDKILKIQPANIVAMSGKAHILYLRKNFNQSLKLYQKVLEANPLAKPDPRIGIGLCFWSLKHKKLAHKAWQNSLKLKYSLDVDILCLIYEIDDIMNNSENDELFSKNFQSLLHKLNEYLQKSSSNPVLLLLVSSIFFSAGNYDKVIKICSKILSSPTNLSQNILSEANFWLARCYFITEDFVNATKFYNEAIKLNNSNALAKLGLAQSQIARNSVEEALISLENNLKTDPHILEFHYLIGMLFFEKEDNQKKKAIYHLERYITLSEKAIEPVHVNTYLVLSEIYESLDLNKSIEMLSKAIEFFKSANMEQPLELFNNIGVFHYLKGNAAISRKFLSIANEKIEGNNDEDFEYLKISVEYNLARVSETFDLTSSKQAYESIISDERLPSYLSAKLRLLFISCFDTETSKENLSLLLQEVNTLLEQNQDVLEVRSFYGWFIRKFGNALKLDKDIESKHHKETLVKYDSHDSFALISLGNAYLSIAREIKITSKDLQEKHNQYLIRATQLFQKVISLDGKNLYATQGLAITFAELKNYGLALEIFKKLKNNMSKTDSTMNDLSIHLNLGNLLVSMKSYSRAIEVYEQALKISEEAKIYTLLGRAWLLRAFHERNYDALQHALNNSEKAYSLKSIPALSFNISFVQFQTAEVLKKLPIQARNITMIENAIKSLDSAITNLTELAELSNPPYSKEDLTSRASMGTNTIKRQLERLLEEQREYENKFSERLVNAKKAQEEEMARKQKLQAEKELKEREEMEKAIEQRKKLEEESSQWLSEMVEAEKDEKDVISDNEAGDNTKQKQKQKKSKKRKIVSDDEDEDDDVSVKKSKKKAAPGGKKSSLSDEFIVDSDEGISEDEPELNDDEEPSEKEEEEAALPAASDKEMDQDED